MDIFGEGLYNFNVPFLLCADGFQFFKINYIESLERPFHLQQVSSPSQSPQGIRTCVHLLRTFFYNGKKLIYARNVTGISGVRHSLPKS
jgi:hypothetical protein